MNARLRWFLFVTAALVGALIALVIVQVQADNALKAQLMYYLSSRSEQRTAEALDMLQVRGWQTDPALRGLDLALANFEQNDLSGFVLSGANLYKASLWRVIAHETILRDTDLRQAALHNSDLRNADLRGADLRDTYLTGANLEGATLQGAQFGPYTLLPNYTYWTAGVDMAMFTDPAHPQFWRSTEEQSPAYSPQATPEPPFVGTPQPTPTVG